MKKQKNSNKKNKKVLKKPFIYNKIPRNSLSEKQPHKIFENKTQICNYQVNKKFNYYLCLKVFSRWSRAPCCCLITSFISSSRTTSPSFLPSSRTPSPSTRPSPRPTEKVRAARVSALFSPSSFTPSSIQPVNKKTRNNINLSREILSGFF